MLKNAALLLPTQHFHVMMMGGNIKNENALMFPQITVASKTRKLYCRTGKVNAKLTGPKPVERVWRHWRT